MERGQPLQLSSHSAGQGRVRIALQLSHWGLAPFVVYSGLARKIPQ